MLNAPSSDLWELRTMNIFLKVLWYNLWNIGIEHMNKTKFHKAVFSSIPPPLSHAQTLF